MEEASPPKDARGVEPINNRSKPQSRLNLVSGTAQYPAHILCTLLFYSLEEDSAWLTYLAEDGLFYGLLQA
jgi:hypothetical protein